MKFSTFHLFSLPPWLTGAEMLHGELEQAEWLEDFGFEEAWLAEHNARVYGVVGSLQIMAAALAAKTKRIRIGAAVTRLPLHHPLHTAEDLALIDVLSNGRFDLGFGKGYDPLEFETYGVPLRRAGVALGRSAGDRAQDLARRPDRARGQALDDPGDGAAARSRCRSRIRRCFSWSRSRTSRWSTRRSGCSRSSWARGPTGITPATRCSCTSARRSRRATGWRRSRL